MKLRLSKAYMGQLVASIKDVEASAKSFSWDELGGIESAQHWYEAFKAGSDEIIKYRRLTNDHQCFEEGLVALKSAMVTGRLRWSEIKEYGF